MKEKVIILWLAANWIVSCTLPLKGLFCDCKNNQIIGVIIIITSVVIYTCTYWKMKKQIINSNPSNLRGNIFVIQIDLTKIFLFFFQANFAVNQ